MVTKSFSLSRPQFPSFETGTILVLTSQDFCEDSMSWCWCDGHDKELLLFHAVGRSWLTASGTVFLHPLPYTPTSLLPANDHAWCRYQCRPFLWDMDPSKDDWLEDSLWLGKTFLGIALQLKTLPSLSSFFLLSFYRTIRPSLWYKASCHFLLLLPFYHLYPSQAFHSQ